jgi:hypothetical protein
MVPDILVRKTMPVGVAIAGKKNKLDETVMPALFAAFGTNVSVKWLKKVPVLII